MAGFLFRNFKDQERPRLKLPLTKAELAIEIIALTGIVAMLALVFANWAKLPDLVPTHFGFSGSVDAWGSKNSLKTLPLFSIFLYILLTVFSRLPHLINYPVRITAENANKEYLLARIYMNVVKLIVIWMFYFLFDWIIVAAYGNEPRLGGLFWGFLAVILLVSVSYFILSFKFAKKKA